MPTPQIHITRTGTAPVLIALSGDHDISTSRELDVAVQHAVAAGGGVVVDLADATFIDSAILRTLVHGHRTAAVTGPAGLVVVAPSGGVAAQLFELVHAAELLSIVPSRAAALARYADHASSATESPSGDDAE